MSALLRKLSALWCGWTHGGGDIQRDPSGKINWRCRKCGRWLLRPVSLADEAAVIEAALRKASGGGR